MELLPLAASRIFDPLSLSLSLAPSLPHSLSLPFFCSPFPAPGLSSGNMADVQSPKSPIHQSSKKLELSKTMTLASGRGIIQSSSSRGIACCLCHCVEIRNAHFDAMRDRSGSVLFFVNFTGLWYIGPCLSSKTCLQLSLPFFFHHLPLNTPIHERSIGRRGPRRLSHLSLQVQSQFLFPRIQPGAAPDIYDISWDTSSAEWAMFHVLFSPSTISVFPASCVSIFTHFHSYHASGGAERMDIVNQRSNCSC